MAEGSGETQQAGPAETREQSKAPVLHVAPSPHVFDSAQTTRKMMADVLIALAPVVAVSIYVFKLHAVQQILICMISALFAEAFFTTMRGKKVTLRDCSAAVTGLILALSLPAAAPWYVGVIGAFVAIGIGKVIFGGLGQNIFNPAMVGRAFVMLAFAGAVGASGYVLKAEAPAGPVAASTQTSPATQPAPAGEITAKPAKVSALADLLESDAITQATPMTLGKTADNKLAAGEKLLPEEEHLPSLGSLFLGTVNGSLGETSALACLIGGLFLLLRRTASWQIPAGVLLAATAIGLPVQIWGHSQMSLGYQLLGGALMFGAFFIATDLVTSPLTPKGKFIFGLGVGALVMMFRLLSNYPEGVMFAVLIMNGLTPLINQWTIPTPLGGPAPAPAAQK
jgi:electron transport complex protein RnfD